MYSLPKYLRDIFSSRHRHQKLSQEAMVARSEVKNIKSPESGSDVRVPARFRHVDHQTEHASFSRLASCLVNEGLVETYLIKTPILRDHPATNYAWIHHGDDEQAITRYEFKIGDFIIPLEHLPWHECIRGGVKKILYFNPEDTGVDAYKMVDPDNPTGSTIPLLERYSKTKIAAEYAMNSRTLLRSLLEYRGLNSERVEAVCAELENTMEHLRHAYVHRCPTPTLRSSAIDWEQGVIEGHSIHPMHKSRIAVAPLAPVVPGCKDIETPDIIFVKLPREGLMIRGDYDGYADRFFPRETLNAVEKALEVVIPLHPLQLPAVRQRVPNAVLLPGFLPTRAKASTRTLALEQHPGWSIKLPLCVKITAAQRLLWPATIYLAPGIVDILDRIVKEQGIVRVIHDIAGVSAVNGSGVDDTHLGCLIRRDEDLLLQDGEIAILGAALCEHDSEGLSYVITAFNLYTHEKRLRWFDVYVGLFLRGFVPPALKYGFSFEPHGQNVTAIFNAETKRVTGFAIRDIGGSRIHKDTLEARLGVKLDILPDSPHLANDLHDVYRRFHHATFVGHMQELIRALRLHYSGDGWMLVRKHIRKVVPQDSDMFKHLCMPMTPFKCFLRMKLDGIHPNDHVYRNLPNPILYQAEGAEWNPTKTECILAEG